MPRPTLRTRLGNRKDIWCHCWPLTTCCSPPSCTATVLPAQIWWSTVGGSGSALGGAVCYFPQQPRLSRCPTAQACSPGLSTVWRLQPGYLPGPLGDNADDDDDDDDGEVRAVKTITWSPMGSCPTGRMGSGHTCHCRPACSLPLSSLSPFGVAHLFHLALTSSPPPSLCNPTAPPLPATSPTYPLCHHHHRGAYACRWCLLLLYCICLD